MISSLPSASIVARITLTLLIATSVLVLLNKAKSGSVSAPQEQPVSKTKPIERKPTRRMFENRIPEHLPIKVKIKREKEKEFRDLENDNWARDLELEVKNVGEKPIYFLWFALEVPEAKIATSHQSFSIMYGRMELADLNNGATVEDLPIMPGETKVLTIEDVGIRGWDEARSRVLVPRIHGVRVIIQYLSFGDGTGFFGTTGAPRPKVEKGPNGTACLPPRDDYGGLPKALTVDSISEVDNIQKPPYAGMFQPASFFPLDLKDFSSSESAATQPDCNCINASCGHGRTEHINTNETNGYCYQCGSIDRFIATPCDEPGACYFWEITFKYCDNNGNHNGVSEPLELHELPQLELAAIYFDYELSKRIDRYGNEFRYRAKIKDTHGAQVGRWAWDVYLMARSD